MILTVVTSLKSFKDLKYKCNKYIYNYNTVMLNPVVVFVCLSGWCLVLAFREMQLPLHTSPIFEKGFGTQLMLLGGSTRQQMLLYIEEKAKKILVVDEYNAVIRHIKQVKKQCFCTTP